MSNQSVFWPSHLVPRHPNVPVQHQSNQVPSNQVPHTPLSYTPAPSIPQDLISTGVHSTVVPQDDEALLREIIDSLPGLSDNAPPPTGAAGTAPLYSYHQSHVTPQSTAQGPPPILHATDPLNTFLQQQVQTLAQDEALEFFHPTLYSIHRQLGILSRFTRGITTTDLRPLIQKYTGTLIETINSKQIYSPLKVYLPMLHSINLKLQVAPGATLTPREAAELAQLDGTIRLNYPELHAFSAMFAAIPPALAEHVRLQS